MTDSGLVIYNDQNIVQINSNYQNPVLQEKTHVIDYQPRTSREGVQMLAIRPDQGQQMTSDAAFNLHRGSGDAYLFEVGSVNGGGSFGLEILTPTGDVAYHSSSKPLRVVDHVIGFQSGVVFGGEGVAWSKIYPFDVAILFNQSEVVYVPATANNGVVFKPHVSRKSNGEVVVRTKAAGSILRRWDNQVVFSSHSEFLVIDVTNY